MRQPSHARPTLLRGAFAAAVAAAALLLAACGELAPPPPARSETPRYDVHYIVGFLPQTGQAEVEIEVRHGAGQLVSLAFSMDERYTALAADGAIERDERGRTVWRIPAAGGNLRYRYRIDHRRGEAYDARITRDGVLVRGDDVVPPAAAIMSDGSEANARLTLRLPEGWTAQTPYRPRRGVDGLPVEYADRRFDRPVGWWIAGDIATRFERLRGTQVAVAAPRGIGVERLQTLAFLRPITREFRQAFGELPPKLLIVQDGDPMWRGGLSGPRSLYLHAERPLISEDGTSTFVHELTHVITGVRGDEHDDWIAEGLAEYYAVVLPERGFLTTPRRVRATLAALERRGAEVTSLRVARSSGDVTARAVVLLAALDEELGEGPDGERRIDALVRGLMARGHATQGRVSTDDMRAEAEALLGRPSRVLADPLLDLPAEAAPEGEAAPAEGEAATPGAG